MLLRVATSDPTTMFRGNSLDAKVFKYFAILVGSPYLWDVLAQFVWEIQMDSRIIDNASGDLEMGDMPSSRSLSWSSSKKSRTRVLVGMEIDPTRMDEAADPKVNSLQLWLTAQKIFSAITRSTNEVPKELAEILVSVHDLVKERHPGEEYKAMGAFLFLRYICPNLLAPHLCGLLEEPPLPTAQRQLILVGKVLQNLSNNTLPGAKEEYMQKLNEFITNNQGDVQKFFDDLLAAPDLQATTRHLPAQVKKNALADIYDIMLASKDKLYQELQDYYDQGDPIFAELDGLMAGEPIPAEQNN